MALNNSLVTLSDLSTLSSLGGGLAIENCNALTDITILEVFTEINGDVKIGYNNNLISLCGLENIASISGDFSVYLNPRLEELCMNPLEMALCSVGDDFFFTSNISLHVDLIDELYYQITHECVDGGIGGDRLVSNNLGQ